MHINGFICFSLQTKPFFYTFIYIYIVDFLWKTLEYYLKPLAQKAKSFINDFLKKLNELRNLPDDFHEVSFHTHFMLDGHCGINDWEIILIDKGCNKQETRKKRAFLAI